MDAIAWIALCTLAFTIIAAIVGTGIRITWYLSKEFSATRHAIYSKVDQNNIALTEKIEENHKEVMNKLEYHERHDDERFGAVTLGLHNLDLKIVQSNGLKMAAVK